MAPLFKCVTLVLWVKLVLRIVVASPQAPTGRRQPGECSNLLSRLLRLADFCAITSFLSLRFPRTTRVAWPTWCWVATTESRYKNLFYQLVFLLCANTTTTTAVSSHQVQQYHNNCHSIAAHDLMILQWPLWYHLTRSSDTVVVVVVSSHEVQQYHSGHCSIIRSCAVILQWLLWYHPQQKILCNETVTTAMVLPHLIFCCGQYCDNHCGISALVYKHFACISCFFLCLNR